MQFAVVSVSVMGILLCASVSDAMIFTMLVEEDADIDGSVQFMQVQTQAVDATPPVSTSFIIPVSRQMKTKKLPPGCPSWASVLNDCEVCTNWTKSRLTNMSTSNFIYIILR